MRCEMTTKNARSRLFEKKEKKEKEEKCETSGYAKGLSHAVLKYLEEKETKALMEKIAEGKKKRTTKTKTKTAVCAVSSERGAGGKVAGVETLCLDDIEGNGEEENAEMKTKKKSKSKKKKTPMSSSSLPALPSKEEEEEKEKKTKKDSREESGGLSRLGSAFDLIQLQVIDPAEMILAGKGKKSDGERNNGGVHDSPREVHQSRRRHEVLSVDRSVRGTPTQTKSFVEAGTSPMEHHHQQQQQPQKQKQQLLLQHQPLVRLDKGTNTDSKPQHGDKKIMLKEKPRRVWRSKSFTKKGRKQQRTEFGVIKDNVHNEAVKTAESAQKRTTESEIRPPTRSDTFKKRRRESIRKQLLMSGKASIVENMRTHSQPNLVQYRTQREREEERKRISLDFNEFLDDAFVCATDVTYAAAERENDNNNILHYPRSVSFPNIASFWKKCEGKEGEGEKDDDNNDGNDEKMDITIIAQSPHQPRRRQKICDCKECVTALMEHAAKVGRFVVAQEEEEKRQRVKEQRKKKTLHRQGTSSAVVATNIPSTTTTTMTTMTTKLMPADPNFLRPPPLLLASEGITTGTFDFAPNPLLTASTSSPLPALFDIIGATTAPNTNKCGASPGALLVDSFVMSPLLDQLPPQKQESG